MEENSKLSEISKKYRDILMAKNGELYTIGSEYNAEHPNTISDGDAKGREDMGNSIDIKKRDYLIKKNINNKDKEYNSGTA